MSALLAFLAAAETHISLSDRLVHGLDWAGRVAVTGAVIGFIMGFELRRRGYRRVRRVGNLSEMLPPSPLDFSGYWGLTGIAIGFIVGVVHG